MTAAEHAAAVRSAVVSLRIAIAAAQADHVEVHPPFTLQAYLTDGNENTGGPNDWSFKEHL